MLFWFIRPIRLLAGVMKANASSKQLAYGVAMGMLLGLIPKGNLFAIAFTTVLLASRIHLGAALLSSISFSWIGVLLDPLSDRLGNTLLTWAPLQSLFARLYELPLAPWTMFNNTVVCGSLIIGLLAFYPVFRLARWGSERYVPIASEKLKQYRVYHVLFGTDLLTSWRAR
jgi:uncharacterized protein (TIGR03546 family)